VNPSTWWHGGPRIDGDRIESGAALGRSRSGPTPDEFVYVTPTRDLAVTYASTVDGTSWVYEVEPDDSPTEVEDSILSGESFRCSGARIIRRFTVSNAQKSLRRRYIPFVVPP